MIVLNQVAYRYTHGEGDSLADFSLSITAGECVALVGESGSGKSTLTKMLNGLATQFHEGVVSGSVTIDGRNVLEAPLYETGKVVGSIFQNPKSQFFATLVEDEVAFACENYGMAREEIEKRVSQSLWAVKGCGLEGKELFHLSSGEKQKVAVASIYALDPDVYVFDEPSANLDLQSIEKLRILLEDLKSQRKTIVIAEHRLYYLKNVVDRYCYIHKGKLVYQWSKGDMQGLTAKERKKLGLRACSLEQMRPNESKTYCPKEGRPRLDIKHLSFAYGREKSVFCDLTFSFTPSLIYGITGENGVGKSTFARILSGLIKPKEGIFCLDGVTLSCKERQAKIFYLSNNADHNLFGATLEEELLLSKTSVNIEKLLDDYGLGEMKEQHPMTLSGGQKQRLSIAAAETLDRDVYVFDEPTSGLDARNMSIIAERLQELKRKNKVILVISHDVEFVMLVCDVVLNIKGNGSIECLTPLEWHSKLL